MIVRSRTPRVDRLLVVGVAGLASLDVSHRDVGRWILCCKLLRRRSAAVRAGYSFLSHPSATHERDIRFFDKKQNRWFQKNIGFVDTESLDASPVCCGSTLHVTVRRVEYVLSNRNHNIVRPLSSISYQLLNGIAKRKHAHFLPPRTGQWCILPAARVPHRYHSATLHRSTWYHVAQPVNVARDQIV